MAKTLQQILDATKTSFRILSKWCPPLAVRSAANLYLTPFPKSKPTVWSKELAANVEEVSLVFGSETIRGWTWKGRGPRVLLNHGWGASAEHWSAAVKAFLAAGFEIWAFDSPAHGASRKKRTNALENSRFVAAVVDRFGPIDAIVGHSWGASSTLYALKEGLALKKAVLIAPFTNSHHTFDAFAKTMELTEVVQRKAKERLLKFFGAHRDGWDMAKIVSKVETEVLIYHDTEDTDVPLADSLELVQNLPHGKLVQTTGLGHRKIQRNAQVLDAIVEFVNSR